MNALPEQEQAWAENQEPLEDDKMNQVLRYLDIDGLNFISQDEMQSFDEKPDFMVSSSHLKELFSAPYNKEKSISLKVQKQGDILKINRMSPIKGNSKGAQKYLQDEPEIIERIENLHNQQIQSVRNQKANNIWNQTWTNISSDSSSNNDFRTQQDICKPSKFSANTLYQKMIDKGVMKKDHFFRKDFGRVLQLKIGNFKMLIGSNLLIFYKSMNYPISLRILQQEKKLNPLSCLDIWLDNVLHNVDESAICYHKNGVVQEYKLLKTEDIPDINNQKSSEKKEQIFDPKIVKANGLNILNFLKENCLKEGGTYWIFKDSDQNQIQLYDLGSDDSDEEKKVDDPQEILNPQNSQLVLMNDISSLKENQKQSFIPQDYQQSRRYAQSLDYNDPVTRLQIMDEKEIFNNENALAYLYLNKAMSITEEAKDSQSINQMRDYLLSKCKSSLNSSIQKGIFYEQIEKMNENIRDNQDQNYPSQSDIDNLSYLNESNHSLASQKQIDSLNQKESLIEKRLIKLRDIQKKIDLQNQIQNQQPLSTKDYEFSKNLCHFHRSANMNNHNSEIEYFKQISEIDLEDLKNQYLDMLQKQLQSTNPNDVKLKIECLHILYHILLIQQQPDNKSLDYCFQMLKEIDLMNASKEQGICQNDMDVVLIQICGQSIIGYQYMKAARQSYQDHDYQISLQKKYLEQTKQADDLNQLSLLKISSQCYEKCLQIKEQNSIVLKEYQNPKIFSQISEELGLIYYQICKQNQTTTRDEFLRLLQNTQEIFTKNKDLYKLARIFIDLLENVKFHFALIEQVKEKQLFAKEIQKVFKGLKKNLWQQMNDEGKKDQKLMNALESSQAKLLLAFGLIVKNQVSELDQQNHSIVDNYFEQSIKKLEKIQSTQDENNNQGSNLLIDIAAANFHRGKTIIQTLENNKILKSDEKRLLIAKKCLIQSSQFFSSIGKYIDSLNGQLYILTVLINQVSNAKLANELNQTVLEVREFLTMLYRDIQSLRKIRKNLKHDINDKETLLRTQNSIDQLIINTSNSITTLVEVIIDSSSKFKNEDYKSLQQRLVEIQKYIQKKHSIEEVISLLLNTIQAK
ncbi:erythroid differentiation-related factor 1 [Stylonychia lemnae]|uniref:Erythroid differentiation-related factor 1 n=1 Tax=Stylonychia lemnae TaxID=5949 RepID=A0A078B0B9_STYLE|nr:erythroid differentiation-related factor 1 [Stylonychia lemnae]|eukprot:CDW87761.1 erythroid differentiation-related factor 1 [Stylonychia lemnae]